MMTMSIAAAVALPICNAQALQPAKARRRESEVGAQISRNSASLQLLDLRLGSRMHPDRTQDGGSSLWGQAAARLLLRPLFRGSLPYWTIGASSDKLSVARERVVTH